MPLDWRIALPELTLNPRMNHGLVIEIDLTEVVPVRVSVQANVGNDVCMIPPKVASDH